MNTIINLLEKKLKLLNNGVLNNEIIEIDILFAKEYDKLLKKFEVKDINDIDKVIFKDDLIKLKKLVKQIIEIEENDNSKKIISDTINNRKITALYKKNMKK
jgi:secreted PhoX family phosphatase